MGVTGIGIGIGLGPFDLGGGAASLLLDDISGVAAAFSVRKLRTAYTGDCIRVRESGGNTEADIGFTGSGDLDTAALLSHCGSNSGYVVTWYDQSGNNKHATQAITTAQPRVVSSGTVDVDGNGVPWLLANHTANAVSLVAAVTTTQPFDVLLVGATQNADARYLFDDSAAADSAIIYSSSGTYQIYAGTAVSSGVSRDATVRFFRGLFNGASSKIVASGTDATGNPGAGRWANGLRLMNRGIPNGARNPASMQEFVCFDIDASAHVDVIANSMGTYFTVTVP